MAAVSVDDQLPAIEDACVVGAEAALRLQGLMPEPQVHLFVDRIDPPYIGVVKSRPYYRGADAVEAIATLGTAAAAAAATRLLLVWEAVDLELSLTGESDRRSHAFVCASASIDGGQELHWYPFQIDMEEPAAGSGEPAGMELWWGQPMLMRDCVLPSPMMRLLERWRGSRPDYREVFPRLEKQGYLFLFVER